VTFNDLALVVIDEQHRFGVHQRMALRDKGKSSGSHPHQLVMTATPIPRTLAMAAYADLDTSVIDELPPGRQPVSTIAIPDARRTEVIERVRSACASGQQAYWVCPLIEESDVLDYQAAEASYQALTDALPDLRIGLVHGRMRAAEKERGMRAFNEGLIQLLVATTVIEVGVDVPNASLMIIENAERMGLSQLHQLRGRVGRGGDQSYCILISSFKLTKDGKTRIETMVRTNNGFEIAEVDMKLRGPGNIEGTQQSGLLQFKIADLVKDAKMLSTARELANRVLEDDPNLEKPHHAPLRRFLEASGHLRLSWSMIS